MLPINALWPDFSKIPHPDVPVVKGKYVVLVPQYRKGDVEEGFLPLADIVERPDISQRLKRASKTALRFLGRAGHSAHFAFDAREQRHQQIGLPHGVRPQHDRL